MKCKECGSEEIEYWIEARQISNLSTKVSSILFAGCIECSATLLAKEIDGAISKEIAELFMSKRK